MKIDSLSVEMKQTREEVCINIYSIYIRICVYYTPHHHIDSNIGQHTHAYNFPDAPDGRYPGDAGESHPDGTTCVLRKLYMCVIYVYLFII